MKSKINKGRNLEKGDNQFSCFVYNPKESDQQKGNAGLKSKLNRIDKINQAIILEKS